MNLKELKENIQWKLIEEDIDPFQLSELTFAPNPKNMYNAVMGSYGDLYFQFTIESEEDEKRLCDYVVFRIKERVDPGRWARRMERIARWMTNEV